MPEEFMLCDKSTSIERRASSPNDIVLQLKWYSPTAQPMAEIGVKSFKPSFNLFFSFFFPKKNTTEIQQQDNFLILRRFYDYS